MFRWMKLTIGQQNCVKCQRMGLQSTVGSIFESDKAMMRRQPSQQHKKQVKAKASTSHDEPAHHSKYKKTHKQGNKKPPVAHNSGLIPQSPPHHRTVETLRGIIGMISKEWISDSKQQDIVRKLLQEAEKQDKLLRFNPQSQSGLKHTRQKISDLMSLASTVSRENSVRGNGSVAHRQALIAKEISPRARNRIPYLPREEQGAISFEGIRKKDTTFDQIFDFLGRLCEKLSISEENMRTSKQMQKSIEEKVGLIGEYESIIYRLRENIDENRQDRYDQEIKQYRRAISKLRSSEKVLKEQLQAQKNKKSRGKLMEVKRGFEIKDPLENCIIKTQEMASQTNRCSIYLWRGVHETILRPKMKRTFVITHPFRHKIESYKTKITSEAQTETLDSKDIQSQTQCFVATDNAMIQTVSPKNKAYLTQTEEILKDTKSCQTQTQRIVRSSQTVQTYSSLISTASAALQTSVETSDSECQSIVLFQHNSCQTNFEQLAQESQTSPLKTEQAQVQTMIQTQQSSTETKSVECGIKNSLNQMVEGFPVSKQSQWVQSESVQELQTYEAQTQTDFPLSEPQVDSKTFESLPTEAPQFSSVESLIGQAEQCLLVPEIAALKAQNMRYKEQVYRLRRELEGEGDSVFKFRL